MNHQINKQMNIRVRKAEIKEADKIHLINKSCLPIYYSPYEYMFYILSPLHDVFVIEDLNNENILLGYLVGIYKNDNFHILSIGVLEKFRKLSLGTKLLSHIICKLRGKYKTITLYVHTENFSAIKFYNKNGFKVQEKLVNYYHGSLKNVKTFDAYFMKK